MEFRNKIASIITDTHLYADKIEYLIRLAIWYLSWIGGVVVLQGKTNGVSSAYFVLSISFLLEFVPQIKNKRELCSRIAHTVFCTIMLFIFVASGITLFNNNYDLTLHTYMYTASRVLMTYMSIDCFLLWCSGESHPSPALQPNELPDKDEVIHIFKARLQQGSLGDISEEDFNV